MAPATYPRNRPHSDAFLAFSPRKCDRIRGPRKDQEAEIIAQRRAKAIVAVGKALGFPGFGVAAAKIPRNQRVPDVHDIHPGALPPAFTHPLFGGREQNLAEPAILPRWIGGSSCENDVGSSCKIKQTVRKLVD